MEDNCPPISKTEETLAESLSLFRAKKEYMISNIKCSQLNFWIFLDNGPVLISYSQGIKINPDLMGGFFSAIRSFSFEILNNDINYIAVQGYNLIFYTEPKKRVFIVGCLSEDVEVEYAKRRLKKIFSLFDILYANYFDTHERVNLEKFQNFLIVVKFYGLHVFEAF